MKALIQRHKSIRRPIARRFVALLVLALLAPACALIEPSSESSSTPMRVERVDLDTALKDPGLRSPVPQRVVLISIEGLGPEAYETRSGARLRSPEASAAPTLTRMAAAGVYADEVVPVFPAVRYSAHAALVTGRRVDRTGIVADHLLGDTGINNTLYWHSSRLVGDSLWRAASDLEMPSFALDWPTTVGADIDRLVSDIRPMRRGETWVGVLEGAATPELSLRVREQMPSDAPNSWPSASARDAVLRELACAETRAPSPAGLWLIRFGQYAAAARVFGPETKQTDAALRRSDEELQALLTCFAEADLLTSTSFVVVGDRRLEPIHTRIRPNVALVEAGLLTPKVQGSAQSVTSWTALVRANGRSGFVYARDEQSAMLARKALNRLATETGSFRIMTAQQMRALHGDPQAWFGIVAEPGFVFEDSTDGAILSASLFRAADGGLPGQPGTGVGFVAWGAGLRAGIRIPRMEQIDVAPTVARLLGLPLQESDGRLLVGGLTPVSLQPR